MPHTKETILFGAPTNFGFSDAIKSELTSLGFLVIDFSTIQGIPFKYKCLGDRLYNCYRKTFFNDYSHKEKLRAQGHKDHLISILDTIPQCDYGLFIRPDFFPIEFIEALKSKVNTLIGYQWDGLKRFPFINDYIPVFDKFYVFDAEDLKNASTLPTTNFYFDIANPQEYKPINDEAYFIGSYIPERMDHIIDLKNVLNTNNIKDNIMLYTNSSSERKDILKNGLTHISQFINYKENLNHTLKASVLIDMHNPIHQGLTFRAFESLGYGKKLITSNPEIKKYDFYRPENIFVWNSTNTNELESFLNVPYIDVDPIIREKYSFKNWIRYILNLENHIPITLPRKELVFT